MEKFYYVFVIKPDGGRLKMKIVKTEKGYRNIADRAYRKYGDGTITEVKILDDDLEFQVVTTYM